MQLSTISPADLSPIATAPTRPGSRFGLCLLYTGDGFIIGQWDGEAWWNEDWDKQLHPVRWLLLEPPPARA